MSDIIENKKSDYQFRGKVTHAAFANAAYHISQDIDYSNFKDAIAERQGAERAQIYGNVWAASFALCKLKDQLTQEEAVSTFHSLTVTDRLMMRTLYSCHKHESMYTWRCQPYYAVAEKLCLVKGESDKKEIAPEIIATALFRDGHEKGWIKEPLSEQEWNKIFLTIVSRFLKDRSTIQWFEDRWEPSE